jgi:ribose 5-phosphate isomerase A
MAADIEQEKRMAAGAAAQLVADGMRVGLGTGSTVAYLLEALAARDLNIECVATSPATAAAGRRLGLDVEEFEDIASLDVTIDGADQVAGDGWLIKGGGGAHTREKVVATAAARFVVIVSSDKMTERLHPPVPLELMAFGLAATLRALAPGPATLRAGAGRSPDDGLIADWHGAFADPAALATQLGATAGVVAHGLFPATLVSDIFVGRGSTVEHRRLTGS